jgi:hypothetical protein
MANPGRPCIVGRNCRLYIVALLVVVCALRTCWKKEGGDDWVGRFIVGFRAWVYGLKNPYRAAFRRLSWVHTKSTLKDFLKRGG